MRCLHPIKVKQVSKDTDLVVYNDVPCGKCPNCIINYWQQWIFRLSWEQKCSSLCLFVTLTYDDEHLSIKNGVPSVNKRDVQLFNKRLRERLNIVQSDAVSEEENKEFRNGAYRYYIASEYGSNTLRPHYHCIMFFSWSVLQNRDELENIISKCWSLGFVRFDSVSSGSIAYVTKYVLKEQPSTRGDKPFTLTSRRPGLGHQYVNDMRDWHGHNPEKMYVVMSGGQKYPLPRYLKDKFGFDKDMLNQFKEQRKIDRVVEEQELIEVYRQQGLDYYQLKMSDYEFKKFRAEKARSYRAKKQKL